MNSGSEVRVALVTGASKGIGRAAALALAEAGLGVVVTARSVEGSLERTADAVRAHGRRALALPFDLANVESVDTTVDSALAEFGHIDVLMNNAFLVAVAGNAIFRSRYAKFIGDAFVYRPPVALEAGEVPTDVLAFTGELGLRSKAAVKRHRTPSSSA